MAGRGPMQAERESGTDGPLKVYELLRSERGGRSGPDASTVPTQSIPVESDTTALGSSTRPPRDGTERDRAIPDPRSHTSRPAPGDRIGDQPSAPGDEGTGSPPGAELGPGSSGSVFRAEEPSISGTPQSGVREAVEPGGDRRAPMESASSLQSVPDTASRTDLTSQSTGEGTPTEIGEAPTGQSGSTWAGTNVETPESSSMPEIASQSLRGSDTPLTVTEPPTSREAPVPLTVVSGIASTDRSGTRDPSGGSDVRIGPDAHGADGMTHGESSGSIATGADTGAFSSSATDSLDSSDGAEWTYPPSLSLEGGGPDTRFIEELYRELTKKMRIENDRGGF